ncbi:MAG: NUDIX domain-containing protein [Planctomycetaceae bacterium]|nr:NUDIX domain-containing protein [Planctomycetaceae bacterium]
MPAISAGILLCIRSPELRVLLAHPGGPYFARKDLGAWTIPKGLVNDGEELEIAARREFEEEIGWRPAGPAAPVGMVRLRSGKIVHGFAVWSDELEAEILARFRPGTFSMEWPPKSGMLVEFPEVDRIGMFALGDARTKIAAAQAPLLDRVAQLLEATQ